MSSSLHGVLALGMIMAGVINKVVSSLGDSWFMESSPR